MTNTDDGMAEGLLVLGTVGLIGGVVGYMMGQNESRIDTEYAEEYDNPIKQLDPFSKLGRHLETDTELMEIVSNLPVKGVARVSIQNRFVCEFGSLTPILDTKDLSRAIAELQVKGTGKDAKALIYIEAPEELEWNLVQEIRAKLGIAAKVFFKKQTVPTDSIIIESLILG